MIIVGHGFEQTTTGTLANQLDPYAQPVSLSIRPDEEFAPDNETLLRHNLVTAGFGPTLTDGELKRVSLSVSAVICLAPHNGAAALDLRGVTPLYRGRCGETELLRPGPLTLLSIARSPSRLPLPIAAGRLLPYRFTQSPLDKLGAGPELAEGLVCSLLRL
jgi:hypothetical protein